MLTVCTVRSSFLLLLTSQNKQMTQKEAFLSFTLHNHRTREDGKSFINLVTDGRNSAEASFLVCQSVTLAIKVTIFQYNRTDFRPESDATKKLISALVVRTVIQYTLPCHVSTKYYIQKHGKIIERPPDTILNENLTTFTGV